jgi:hypothetical protein
VPAFDSTFVFPCGSDQPIVHIELMVVVRRCVGVVVAGVGMAVVVVANVMIVATLLEHFLAFV